jgi:hypothetical protein
VEQLSGYEIAQQRIEARQKQRFRAGIAFAMFFLLLFLTLLAGPAAYGCLVPLILTFGLLALFGAAQLYYASPRGAPSIRVVEDQMNWLFGDGWRDVAGTNEFILAQERIRRRRTRRTQFYFHLTIFILAAIAMMPLLISGIPSGSLLLLFPLIWLSIVIAHGLDACPSRGRLESEERQIGQAILTELDHSARDIEKRKEKPKNDVRYAIGEDGELVEIAPAIDEKIDRASQD